MKLRIALAAAAAGLAATSAANAAPATANTTAQVNIVAPAALTATRDLEFGTIAKPTAGSSTVTLASAASGTATPTVTGSAFVPTGGLAHAAAFHLIGTNGQTYSITTNSLSFTGATGNLSAIGAESPVAASGTLLTLPASGTDDLYIGGHFDISSTTAVSTYNGTLSLTVNFN